MNGFKINYFNILFIISVVLKTIIWFQILKYEGLLLLFYIFVNIKCKNHMFGFWTFVCTKQDI